MQSPSHTGPALETRLLLLLRGRLQTGEESVWLKKKPRNARIQRAIARLQKAVSIAASTAKTPGRKPRSRAIAAMPAAPLRNASLRPADKSIRIPAESAAGDASRRSRNYVYAASRVEEFSAGSLSNLPGPPMKLLNRKGFVHVSPSGTGTWPCHCSNPGGGT